MTIEAGDGLVTIIFILGFFGLCAAIVFGRSKRPRRE